MIRNKSESDYIISKLGLNRMAEGIFTQSSTEEDLRRFLEENTYEYYNIRDKTHAGGQFLYKLTADGVIEHSKDYQRYSVYESLAEADEKLILQGEMEIDKQFKMVASLSDIRHISNRSAMQTPEYHLQVDLAERREPHIRGLTEVINYIAKHGLFDVVVEFSLFEIPVGIYKETIIIWELRNY